MDAKRAANIARYKLYIEREMKEGFTDENERGAFWAMAMNALEKAIPKSPKEKSLDFGDKVLVCPNCGTSAIGNTFSRNGKQYPHCPWCGQKLKGEEGSK